MSWILDPVTECALWHVGLSLSVCTAGGRIGQDSGAEEPRSSGSRLGCPGEAGPSYSTICLGLSWRDSPRPQLGAIIQCNFALLSPCSGVLAEKIQSNRARKVAEQKCPMASGRAAITKYLQLCGLNNRRLFSQLWRLLSPRLRCWQIWFLARACFLAYKMGHLVTVPVSLSPGLFSVSAPEEGSFSLL